jgi:putative transposase
MVHWGPMNWKRMLAYVTDSVDQELLLRNQYLVTENRVLRNQIKGRVVLSDPERLGLATIAKQLSRKALAEVAQIVRPETLLAWHRRLIAEKFDDFKNRSAVEPRSTTAEVHELVLRFAQDNRAWGYRRIVGVLYNLGYQVSHQTVANLLKRHGLEPAPERQKTTTWKEFIRSHTEVLAAVDFFTVEVWTGAGLLTYYVLTFMRVASRHVCVAGITPSPDAAWMEQMARNVTMADTGFLNGCRYLLHDRDAKFCATFDAIFQAVGVKVVKLPPRSPNLNAHCERWIRSVRTEVLSKMIFFGERSLRHCLDIYVSQYHTERNHQGKANVMLFPLLADRIGEFSGSVRSRERLGGLLRFYYREAA